MIISKETHTKKSLQLCLVLKNVKENTRKIKWKEMINEDNRKKIVFNLINYFYILFQTNLTYFYYFNIKIK